MKCWFSLHVQHYECPHELAVRSQDPLDLDPSLPLPKTMRFPGVSLYISVPFAAATCLVWETSSYFPFEIGCPESHSQGLGKDGFILHRICREWEKGSDFEQLWLNNCVKVIEIRVFPGEKDFLLKMLDWMHLGYPENLGMYHNFLKVFFFFPSPSFTLVLFRTEILESEILPIPINMTF